MNKKKYRTSWIWIICFMLTAVPTTAQENSLVSELDDTTFWTEHVDSKSEWGIWLKEVYRPYRDDLTLSILRLVGATAELDLTGKSKAEVMAEVTAAFNERLEEMENLRIPQELKDYHEKTVERFRLTIEADPDNPEENKIAIARLAMEADQEMIKIFKLHGVPDHLLPFFFK